MAELTKSYRATGVLSISDMELTETNKKGIFTHDFAEALRNFDGEEITIQVTKKEEVAPKSEG